MSAAEVAVGELRDAIASGARLIDVREPHEFERGHIPGAQLMPLQTVPEHIDRLRAESPCYVICRTGARSRRACEFLAEHGIDAINVAGGILAWADLGEPIVQGAEG